MTTPRSSKGKDTASPLEEYLALLEKRDKHEKRHEKYINAFTKLADRTAAEEKVRLIAERDALQTAPTEATEASTSEAKPRSYWQYYPSSGGKSSPTPAPPEPANIAQVRADLAAANKIRAEQDAQITHFTTENSTFKALTNDQSQRITELEKKNKLLERRVKDTTEEAKGQRKLAEEVQDELLVLQIQMNAKDKKNEKLQADNDELTRRWMAAKEEESRKMNEDLEKGLRK